MKFNYLIALVALYNCQTSDEDVRNATCESNINTCSTICANNNSTATVNKCDPQTYNFQCTCKNFTPPQDMNTFPAAYQACYDKKSDCVAKCGGDSSCSTQCAATFQCISKDVNDGKTAKPSTSSTKTSSQTSAPNINAASNLSPLFAATTIAILLMSV